MLPDAHPGYITWEEYQENQKRLRESAQAYGHDRCKRPPGEGPALLQGLVVCGCCGRRMTIRYHQRSGRLIPDYVCQRNGIEHGERICQSIPGSSIDKEIGRLLLDLMTPATLDVSLAVQEELRKRHEEADSLRRKQVERARYEVELAQRRYMQVDPGNRLVADALEADWNERLRDLSAAQEEYERQRKLDQASLDERERQKILELASDFPRLWRDAETSDQQRKKMVRLLIEDVTLTKDETLKVQVRFKGGATREFDLPLPRQSWQLWQTAPKVIQEIDDLLNNHTDNETAEELNRRGFQSGKGSPFNARIVSRLRRDYGLKSRFDRLRELGKLTQAEIAKRLGVSNAKVHALRRQGHVIGHAFNNKNECLYDPPAGAIIPDVRRQ